MTRQRVYEIIEKPIKGNRASVAFGWALMILIWLNVAAVILGSVDEIQNRYSGIFASLEFFSIVIFSLEYVLRLWTAPEKFKGSKEGSKNIFSPYLSYIFSFLGIIDLCAILPFYLPFITNVDLIVLRILRTFRLLRILKLSHYSKSFNSIATVLQDEKKKLFTTLFFIVLMILLASTLMYFVESNVQPDKFPNIPATLWWAVATLTTVGYGDVYPVTIPGKILGSIIAIMGIGLIAMPSGIISAGLMAQSHKEHSEKTVRCCPFCGENIEHYLKPSKDFKTNN